MTLRSFSSDGTFSPSLRLIILLLLASTVFLMGCDSSGSNQKENKERNDGGGEAPALSIDTTEHDYGFVHVGTPQTRTFTLINNGSPPPDSVDRDSTLEGEVTLDGSDVKRFTIQSGAGSFALDPADSLDVVVEFDPDEDQVTNQARIDITHNDPDRQNPLSVSLQGDGVAFEGGSGRANDPYQIVRPDQLQVIDSGLREENFVLVNDVDATATRNWNEGAGFIPIGKGIDGKRFTGTLDGAGYVISNLSVQRPDSNRVGLFAAVGKTLVENVTLRGVDITGRSQTGGLAGQNAGGTIQSAKVEGTVNGNVSVGGVVGVNVDGGTVQSTQSNVSVHGETIVGGLVGRNRESIVRIAVAEGTVEGTGKPGQVGGLVGRNAQGEIRQSTARGSVSSSGDRGQVGGLVGRNVGGKIQQSTYGDGTVEARASAGGLVGANFAGGTIRDSRSEGRVLSQDRAGGLVGRNAVKGTILRSSSTADVEADQTAGGLVGLNREQVRFSWASGSVRGETNIGGLVGVNLGTVESSYTHGPAEGTTRVGGLVGRGNEGALQHSYATGSISGSSEVGGLVGRQTGSSVSSSYWNVNATGQSDPVGTRDNTSIDAVGLSTDEMTGTAAPDNMDDLDFSATWTTVPDQYPAFQWEE